MGSHAKTADYASVAQTKIHLGINATFYLIVEMTKCDGQPCQNGGLCVSRPDKDPSWYKCYCDDGFDGENCERKV